MKSITTHPLTKLAIVATALVAAVAAAPSQAQSLGIAVTSPINHGRGSVSVGLSAPIGYAQPYSGYYQPAYAPIRPAPLRESIPYLPPGYVWIPGYWALSDDNAYSWIPGYSRYDGNSAGYGYAPAPYYNSYYGSPYYGAAPAVILGLGINSWNRNDRWDRNDWRPSHNVNRPHRPNGPQHDNRPGRPGGDHGRPGGGDHGRPGR